MSILYEALTIYRDNFRCICGLVASYWVRPWAVLKLAIALNRILAADLDAPFLTTHLSRMLVSDDSLHLIFSLLALNVLYYFAMPSSPWPFEVENPFKFSIRSILLFDACFASLWSKAHLLWIVACLFLYFVMLFFKPDERIAQYTTPWLERKCYDEWLRTLNAPPPPHVYALNLQYQDIYDCAICHDPFAPHASSPYRPRQRESILRCGHRYHHLCLRQYEKSQFKADAYAAYKCPTCRQPYSWRQKWDCVYRRDLPAPPPPHSISRHMHSKTRTPPSLPSLPPLMRVR